MLINDLPGNDDYRDFLDRLQKIKGLDKMIDFPIIAVMGDTSSGKSSLLSQISGVELPSAHHMTTCCPIELKMEKGHKLIATISIDFKEENVKEEHAHVKNFKPIIIEESNWSDIADRITKVQSVIFGATGKKAGHQVSRSVVKVNVCGPHYENLTLIDLPGIVRSTGKGQSESLSTEIQNLMNEYLQNRRCVILAVHAANVDFHNSSIMADAKKVDPQTSRTLPVLTKPDLIDIGAEDGVKNLLLGYETDGFEKGFHMVKGRGQAALDEKTSIAEALEKEEHFFGNNEPWRSIEDRSLFGTKELRAKLGALQMDMIKSSFPEILEELKETKSKNVTILDGLGTFPKSEEDRRVYFYSATESYHHRIEASQNGRVDHGNQISVGSRMNNLSRNLQMKINESRLASIDRLSVGDDAIATLGPNPVKGKVEKVHGTEENRSYDIGVHRGIPQREIPQGKVRRDPKWLFDILEKSAPLGPSIYASQAVFASVVTEDVKKEWEPVSINLVVETAKLMKEEVNIALKSDTRLSSVPKLQNFIRVASNDLIDQLESETKTRIEELMAAECHPFTQDPDFFQAISRARNQTFHMALFAALGFGPNSANDHSSMPKSQIYTILNQIVEDHAGKSPMDHMAEDLQITLAAYGKAAVKRVADAVPICCQKMLLDFSKQVKHQLSKVTDKKLEELLEVPAGVKGRFDGAQQAIEKVDCALKLLSEI